MDGSQRKRQYYVFWGFRASQAELLLGGSSYARLNVLNGTSVNSMVSSGKLLRVSYADGTVASHFDEAGMTAFVQFQWLRADDFSKRLTLLQDKGIVAIGDLKFDKLSIRLSKASASAQAAAVKRSSAQADFYFDPATFLLSKVVTPLKLPGTANTVLQVTSYSNYRAVDKVLVPFTIEQSIDGQPQWSLTLSDVSFPAKLDSTSF